MKKIIVAFSTLALLAVGTPAQATDDNPPPFDDLTTCNTKWLALVSNAEDLAHDLADSQAELATTRSDLGNSQAYSHSLERTLTEKAVALTDTRKQLEYANEVIAVHEDTISRKSQVIDEQFTEIAHLKAVIERLKHRHHWHSYWRR